MLVSQCSLHKEKKTTSTLVKKRISLVKLATYFRVGSSRCCYFCIRKACGGGKHCGTILNIFPQGLTPPQDLSTHADFCIHKACGGSKHCGTIVNIFPQGLTPPQGLSTHGARRRLENILTRPQISTKLNLKTHKLFWTCFDDDPNILHKILQNP